MVSVEQQVEVQGPRTIHFDPSAAMPGFDFVQEGKEMPWGKAGFATHDGIDKIGLYRPSDRDSATEPAAGQDAGANMGADGFEGITQMRGTVPEIRTQAYEHHAHGSVPGT